MRTHALLLLLLGLLLLSGEADAAKKKKKPTKKKAASGAAKAKAAKAAKAAAAAGADGDAIPTEKKRLFSFDDHEALGLSAPADVVALRGEAGMAEHVHGDAEGHTWLVLFYAPWCAHCAKLAPEYAKTAAISADADSSSSGSSGLGQYVRFGAVDLEAHPKMAAAYNIVSLPSLKLFSGPAQLNPYKGTSYRTANDFTGGTGGRVSARRYDGYYCYCYFYYHYYYYYSYYYSRHTC